MKKKWILFIFVLLITLVISIASILHGENESFKEFYIIQQKIKSARDKVMPALVRVQPIIDTYYGGKKITQTQYGSGVIINSEGYIITNYHVAGRAKSCICILADKEEVQATLVGGDPWTDIAVIKLELHGYKNKIQWANMGNSDEVDEGDFVLALGSPFSLTRTITFGIISCKDRSLGVLGMGGHQTSGQFNTWLQTDALINPGNSGGPLVNAEGEVIGINALGGSGMGFAIPINIVRDVSNQIIKYGEVKRSWIGVHFKPIEKFKKYFLADLADGGVLIENVDLNSPADTAGIQSGDILISLNEKPISAKYEEEIYPVAKKLSDLPIGSKIDVKYIRNKKIYETTMTTEKLESAEGDQKEFKEWGFTVKEITKPIAINWRLKNQDGVLVTGTINGSIAYKAGISYNDIIVEMDGVPVKNIKQFEQLFNKIIKEKKKNIVVKILRDGRTSRILIVDQSQLNQ